MQKWHELPSPVLTGTASHDDMQFETLDGLTHDRDGRVSGCRPVFKAMGQSINTLLCEHDFRGWHLGLKWCNRILTIAAISISISKCRLVGEMGRRVAKAFRETVCHRFQDCIIGREAHPHVRKRRHPTSYRTPSTARLASRFERRRDNPNSILRRLFLLSTHSTHRKVNRTCIVREPI